LNLRDVNICGQKLSRIIQHLLTKGTRVTIVVGELPEKEKDKKFFIRLLNGGAKIYYNKRVHVKLILIDRRSYQEVLLMTANLTKTGLYRNYEAGILISRNRNFYNKAERFVKEILKSPTTQPLGRRQRRRRR